MDASNEADGNATKAGEMKIEKGRREQQKQ